MFLMSSHVYFFNTNLFILIGGWLLYNIVFGFAIYWHESATGVHVFPILNPSPSSLPLLVISVHQPQTSSIMHWNRLNIWKFTVHILSRPGLENFEHYFTSVWDEYNCAVVQAFFGIAFLWDWNELWPFPVLWPLLSFGLSAALSQHHLLGFEIVQLEFHHLH